MGDLSGHLPTERLGIRLKRLRLAVGWFRDLLLGRRLLLCRPTPECNHRPDWPVIADFPTIIRWRAELGPLNQNRVENMQLCCRILDGICIRSGEVFSLQHILGEPTHATGFKAGPTIQGNRMGTSVGGGVCQISTALFNAALLANLQILEKHNHSRDVWGPARMIELGRDAAYVFARYDLKFRNSHSHEVVIRIQVDAPERTLHCRLVSPAPLACRVSIESVRLGVAPLPFQAISTRRLVHTDGGPARVNYQKVELYL